MITNKRMGFLRRMFYWTIVSVILSGPVILFSHTAEAATYYLAPSGSDSSPGTLSAPWQTINKANASLQQGDTVYIRAGTYRQTIKPSRSGTAGNPITYSRYNNEEVIITGVTNGVYLSTLSYIVIDGIKIQDVNGEWVTLHNSHYNTIRNCYMDGTPKSNWSGISIGNPGESNYNKFINNTLTGPTDLYEPYGGPSDLILLFSGHHNLIEGNIFGPSAHQSIDVQNHGNVKYNIIRNNLFRNLWHSNLGVDVRTEYTLVENNIILDAGENYHCNQSRNGASEPRMCEPHYLYENNRWRHEGLQLKAFNSIIRQNVFINNGEILLGLQGTVVNNNDRLYKNTFSQNYAGIYNGLAKGEIFKNNIFYNQRDYEIYTRDDGNQGNSFINNNVKGGKIVYGANLWQDNISLDPLFVDEQNRDLHLQSTSPMIDAGAFLTKTVNSDTGTSMKVEDAHYFMDGWGIIEGDLIQLQGQTQTARITNVDYSANTLTLDTSLIWTNGLGVSLPYNGLAPDIGAYEYDSSVPAPAYTLTVSKNGAGSGTVTSAPAGINCGADCAEPYNSSTVVTLMVAADIGSTFTGWAGACSGIGACVVTMDSDKTVTANFISTSISSNQYSRQITINGSAVAQNNYQVLVTADTATPISEGKMQPDGDDIRFTNFSGAPLSYWIESGINTTSTKIWVKVDSIPVSGAVIFMQYGDPAAISSSNGTATFDFFDSFDSFDGVRWTGTGAYSVAGSRLSITTGSVYSKNTVSSQPNYITEAKVKWSNFTDYSGMMTAGDLSTGGANSGADKLVYYMTGTSGSANVNSWIADGIGTGYDGGDYEFTSTANTDYIISYSMDSTQTKFYKDRVITNTRLLGEWTGPFYLWFGYFKGSASGTSNIADISIDWVIIRKYATLEPVVGPLGEEIIINPTILTVSKSGIGNGTIISAPAGINCGADCTGTYNENTVVTLTVIPDTGSTFTGWSGACSGTGACVVTMDLAKTVIANFAPVPTYILTVSKTGTGSGTVISVPSGIICGADCTEPYNENTIVTLTAVPDTGSTFTGWSGACSGTGACVVTMDAAKSVTANFTISTSPTYYIAPTGNDSNPGTISAPWQTINKANTALQPNDTVYIRAGTYQQTIEPSRSGTAGNPITYARYNNEEVIITGVNFGANLSSRSYITIDGIRFIDTTRSWVVMINSQHNIIKNSYMKRAGSDSAPGIYMREGEQAYNKIINNTISGPDALTDAPFCGPWDLINIGGAGHHNLIEGNNIEYASHSLISFDSTGSTHHNIIRNNILRNLWHSNIAGGGDYQLIENNIILDGGETFHCDQSQCGASEPRMCTIPPHYLFESNRWRHAAIQFQSYNSIARKNIFINNGAFFVGREGSALVSNNRVYQNTFNKNYVGVHMGASRTEIFKNNIFSNQRDYELYESPAGVGSNSFINNNIKGTKTKLGTNLFQDNLSLDPLFMDEQNRDLHLQPNSPMIDAAAFLTKTVNSSTGTSMKVEDALYFMDGWGIIEGDIIQLQGQTQTARIISIDYSTNTLTLDAPLTWTNGLGVSLAYNGAAPDIGAYEYETVSGDPIYTLTISKSGTGSGTVTSSPIGINCGADCTEPYNGSTVVTLMAAPDTGSTFTGWSGACSGTGACVVTMDAAKSVTANFTLLSTGGSNVASLATATASSVETPPGIGTADKAIDGIVSGYPVDSSKEWASNGERSGAWLQLDWSKNYLIDRIVIYDRPNSDDQVTSATITFSDTSIISVGALTNDSSGVEYKFTPRSVNWLKFTVNTVSGSTLNIGLSEIEVYGEEIIINPTILTVSKSGIGNGTIISTPAGINCGADCTESYNSSTVVTLMVAADTGSAFTGWSGACSGTGACVVTMDADKSVTASFAPVPTYILTVSKTGTGSGTVTSVPSGIICGADCTEPYNENTIVTLTAVPDTGSTFTGWSDVCLGTGACVVTMDAVKSVTADFTIIPPKIGIIVDHNNLAEFAALTASDMDNIRTLKILFGHQSVGRNILGGLSSLGSQNSMYRVNISPTNYSSDVSSSAYNSGGVFGHQNSGTNGNQSSKNNEFFGFLNTNFSKVNVAFLKYCYVDVTSSLNATSIFNNYKARADTFMRDHPEVKLVHLTAPLTTGNNGDNVQRNIYRNLILAEYGASGYVFDIADIESYRNDVPATFSSGGKTYLMLNSAYTSDGGHLNSEGSIVVAKALHVMLNKIGSGTPPPTPTYSLNIVKSGTGSGTVTSMPAGINCGVDCTEIYNGSTVVTLMAATDTGSTFAGWSGACSGTGACVVTMDAAKSVTATFALTSIPAYTLTVSKNGAGSGTVTSTPAGINCGADCTEPYNGSTVVTLMAAADIGSTFTGWAGTCSGIGTCVVTMDSDKTVTANFISTSISSNQYSRQITINGSAVAQNNYQVLITADTASLIIAGKMQPDGDDIRFTNFSGTPLSYWIESGINTTSTKIWVKVDSIPVSGTTIFMQYGDPTAISSSNGTATFDFFDDFNSFDSTRWTGTGAYSVAGSRLSITTGSVYSKNTVSSQPNYITEAKVKWSNFADYSGMMTAGDLITAGTNSGADKLVYYMTGTSGSANIDSWIADGIGTGYDGGDYEFTSTANTDYIISYSMDSTQTKFYKDRVITNTRLLGEWTGPFYLWFGYFKGSASGTSNIADISIDWVIIRKYATLEPVVGPLGEETILDTTPPTTTATPAGGTYTIAQSVCLACSDTGSGCGNIYYTTDGSTPTTSSNIYTVPIDIAATTTLKFFAMDLAGNAEAVQTQDYTITAPPIPYNNLYLAWSDTTYGNSEILFKKSTDGGNTWTPVKRITNNSGTSTSPSIASEGDNIYLVWSDTTYGNSEIFFKSSIDGGNTWTTIKRLTNNSGLSILPDITINGTNIYVVWTDDTYSNSEILFRKSTDGGTTWTAIQRLTNNSGISSSPSITTDGVNIYLAWQDTTFGNNEIFFKSSTDGGNTWTVDQRITNNIGWSTTPVIKANGGSIYLTWTDDTYGNSEILFKKSTDKGTTWIPVRRVTYNSGFSGYQRMKTDGDNIYLAWQDTTYGNTEILFKKSTDGGNTWIAFKRITFNTGLSQYPFISIDLNNIYITWQDDSVGNTEILFKKSTDGGTTWAPVKRITNNSGLSETPVMP